MNRALVLSTDINYIIPLKVFMHSMHQTRSIPKDTPIFLLHDDTISEQCMDDLNYFFGILGVSVNFINAEKTASLDSNQLQTSHHLTIATYHRLFTASLLPDTVTSAVYLDIDTLAMQSIRGLFEINLGNHLIAAVDHLAPAEQLRIWGESSGTYFNAGVLIINLERWRQSDVERSFLEIIKKAHSRIRWADQDVLNIAFGSQWGRLPITFNVHETAALLLGMDQAHEKSKLIHYTGSLKPWSKPKLTRLDDEWFKSLMEVCSYTSIPGAKQLLTSKSLNTPITYENRHSMLKAIDLNDKNVVEIGVFTGKLSDFIFSNFSCRKLHLVDPFEGNVISGDQDGNNVEQAYLPSSYESMSEKYKSETNVILHRMISDEFFKTTADDSLDIVYIDGDHSYKGHLKDLENAFQKVKHGGYIMGHDYSCNPLKTNNVYEFGVKRAVSVFCRKYNQVIYAMALDGCTSYAIQISKR